MFKKFVKRILAAENDDELSRIMYDTDGIDMMYQKEKLSWEEHEILFELIGRVWSN